MSLTLLQIVQTAASELGLNAPASVVGSNDLQIKQLRALTQRDCNDLFRSRDWTFLQKEFIINLEEPITVTGNVTTGSRNITNLSSVTGIEAGSFAVSGNGVPQAQRVSDIVSATEIECEMEATATEVGATLIFARDTYEIPADFDHYISKTWWDRTNHWMLMGPQSPQFDQWQRSGIVTTGPRRRWRQIGRRPTVYRIWPPPTGQDAPAALAFEYVSNEWVLHPDDSYGNLFTTDEDIPLLNEQAIILGVKWRFWQIKGFSYGALQKEYVDFVDREKARDGGIPDVSMNRRRFPYLISSGNVQDGNFPSS